MNDRAKSEDAEIQRETDLQRTTQKPETLGFVTPEPNNAHGQRHARETGPGPLHPALLIHFFLDTLAIHFLLSLHHHEILVFLGCGLAPRAETGCILNEVPRPDLESILSVEPVIDAVGSDDGGETHPDEIGMLSMLGRDGVSEQKASVGEVGETQTVFATQTFHLMDGPGGICGGWEELERWDGDSGSGV